MFIYQLYPLEIFYITFKIFNIYLQVIKKNKININDQLLNIPPVMQGVFVQLLLALEYDPALEADDLVPLHVARVVEPEGGLLREPPATELAGVIFLSYL